MPSRPIVLSLLSAVFLAVGAARADCIRTFELVAPSDWRCSEEPPTYCLICRNRSTHYTDLVVHCATGDADERHPMPPGGAVSFCGGRPS